jgi:hypothetical protein
MVTCRGRVCPCLIDGKPLRAPLHLSDRHDMCLLCLLKRQLLCIQASERPEVTTVACARLLDASNCDTLFGS